MARSEKFDDTIFLNSIAKSCENMSATKTGALIVVVRQVGLNNYIETGDQLSAQFSQQLIETIFFKNTPLHDGAMIVDKHHIMAAGCILPPPRICPSPSLSDSATALQWALPR